MANAYSCSMIDDKKVDASEYDLKCQDILDDPEIRFAALLDESGTILAGGTKPGMTIRLSEEQLKTVCIELASRVAKRKKLDTELGRVKYSASRREFLVIMSFPIHEKVVMIVAESHVNIDRLAFRVISKLGRQWGEFVGK